MVKNPDHSLNCGCAVWGGVLGFAIGLVMSLKAGWLALATAFLFGILGLFCGAILFSEKTEHRDNDSRDVEPWDGRGPDDADIGGPW